MKQYKAIIFDWDGTAVVTRSAPTDEVVPQMIKLLEKGILMIIVSGTTYENIAGGKLHEEIPAGVRKNLFLGLGRGAYNYGFNEKGELVLMTSVDKGEKSVIDRVAYDLHEYLFENFGYETDIVFSRPNYCKIDLLVNHDRKGKLYFQSSELDMLNENLKSHGYSCGIKALMDYATELGRKYALNIKVTTDAKYLEIGTTTKGDNVDFFMKNVIEKQGITASECCFWGDEFTFLGEEIKGSDALMITELSQGADFYDVSEKAIYLPAVVQPVGGGVKSFIDFLAEQRSL